MDRGELPELIGERLVVRAADYPEWREVRALRFSEDVLRYDHPNRPLPSVEQEREFWEQRVETNRHLLFAILRGGALIGFVSLFELDRVLGSCETGIELLRAPDHARGYGTEAYGLLLPWLQRERGLGCVYALTHPENVGALRMYGKLGFARAGRVPDGPVTWVRLEYHW